jgi:hypothetical protein
MKSKYLSIAYVFSTALLLLGEVMVLQRLQIATTSTVIWALAMMVGSLSVFLNHHRGAIQYFTIGIAFGYLVIIYNTTVSSWYCVLIGLECLRASIYISVEHLANRKTYFTPEPVEVAF